MLDTKTKGLAVHTSQASACGLDPELSGSDLES